MSAPSSSGRPSPDLDRIRSELVPGCTCYSCRTNRAWLAEQDRFLAEEWAEHVAEEALKAQILALEKFA